MVVVGFCDIEEIGVDIGEIKDIYVAYVMKIWSLCIGKNY